MYCFLGFLGIQARKHAKHLAKGSKQQLYLSYFHTEPFVVRNKEDKEVMQKIITDETMPLSLVETWERYGSLSYANGRCWIFFF